MTVLNATSEFLLHCEFEKTLSQKTLKAYKTDLHQVMQLLQKKGCVEISEVTKQEIREYLMHLSTFKPKTIKRKLASLKAFFNYLEFEDKLHINPFRKMRIKIKEPQKLPSVMDMSEIIKLFKKAYYLKSRKVEGSYQHQEALRNIVVLELLFSTGARVSEIANLKYNSIHLSSGNVIIKGKGNKERVIQICNQETLALLKIYSQQYEKNIKQSGGWFLTNRHNKKLSDQSIRLMVKRLAREAGITKRITPHVFRHSFATLLLEKDVDIKYIQSLLGHSSIMTTQIYTHVSRRRQKQILKAKHPRRDFSMA